MQSLNENFICPISKDIMLNPVQSDCHETHIFDRRHIELVRIQFENRCPLCNRTITRLDPATLLQREIHTFIQNNPDMFEGKSLETLNAEQNTHPRTHIEPPIQTILPRNRVAPQPTFNELRRMVIALLRHFSFQIL